MDLTYARARKLDNPEYVSKISTKLNKVTRKKVSPTAVQKSPIEDNYENKYASKKELDTPKFVNDTIGKETNVESASFY